MKKINVAELLKNCPKGMELDCLTFDNVFFQELDWSTIFPIICYRINNGIKENMYLTEFGSHFSSDGAKCVIFPKGKTSWERFAPPCKFKDGDIVTCEDSGALVACIYKERKSTQSFNHHIALYKGGLGILVNGEIVLTDDKLSFATEEEKQKLFQAIKENGYKWNPETKTLEKLPMFKVGDKIKLKGGDEFGIITEVADCFFTIQCKNNTHCWPIKKQDDWELINEPKFKVGDKIKDKNNRVWFVVNVSEKHFDISSIPVPNAEGYFVPIEDQDNWELVPNKFDISTLVPFESRVLIRDSKSQKWSPAIWGFYDFDSQDYRYKLVGIIARYCIPYEGNEHLLGTTDDCSEYFKIWKN